MEVIGIVGAGVMGRGIVQLFAQAGHELRLFDADRTVVEKAVAFIGGMIERQAAKGTLTESDAATIKARIRPCASLGELAGCTVVIEAIVERLEAKQALLRDLEPIVGADCILASNTSSLLISAIASDCAIPARVAGLHFFNPVPLMKIAEVIPGC